MGDGLTLPGGKGRGPSGATLAGPDSLRGVGGWWRCGGQEAKRLLDDSEGGLVHVFSLGHGMMMGIRGPYVKASHYRTEALPPLR